MLQLCEAFYILNPIILNSAYRSTFQGLRSDTEYIITISFVLSGRKLGSESFTILSHDRKTSASSLMSLSALNSPLGSVNNTPKTSVVEDRRPSSAGSGNGPGPATASHDVAERKYSNQTGEN